jgi:hypothetical protein
VKLMPPIYVKPFVKRQKNDMADAEAIAEAASRPTMRFVAVKAAEQQGQGMLFRTRDLLVRQRAQSINALRGHLAEFGVVAPKGSARVDRLAQAVADETVPLPATVRELAHLIACPQPTKDSACINGDIHTGASTQGRFNDLSDRAQPNPPEICPTIANPGQAKGPTSRSARGIVACQTWRVSGTSGTLSVAVCQSGTKTTGPWCWRIRLPEAG